MKRSSFLSVLIFLLIGVAGLAADSYGSAGASKDADITLEDMLVYALQDEQAARAEYALIMDQYGDIRPFTNIIRSEEQHIRLLEPLFVAHGISAPEDVAAQRAVLPESLEAAFEIGVEAEIANIAMYEMFLDRDLPQDVRDVFERLKAGSENHLRSFENNLRRYR